MTHFTKRTFPKACAIVLVALTLSACKEDAPGPDASAAEIMLYEASTAQFRPWVFESGDSSEALHTIDDVYADLIAQSPNDPRLTAELAIVEEAKTLLGEAFAKDGRGRERRANAALQTYLTAWARAEIAAQDHFDTMMTEITAGNDPSSTDIAPIVKAYLMDPSQYDAAERLRQITTALGDTESHMYYAKIDHAMHASAYISGGEFSAYFAYGLALHDAGDHAKAWRILTHNMGSAATPSSDYRGTIYVPARANYVSLMIDAPEDEHAVWAATHNLMLGIRTDFARADAAHSDVERQDPELRQKTTQDYLRIIADLWDIGLQKEAHELLSEAITYAGDNADLVQPLNDWGTAHPL